MDDIIKNMRFVTTKGFLFMLGLVAGAVVILALRFALYQPGTVHYHANFALYINGQQEQFKGPQYYEEDETMCSTAADQKTPMGRAHMHDNVNNVVHVEDQAVTWGNFFANLGWMIGPTVLASPDGTVYAETSAAKLHIILNDQDYTDLGGINNRVIKDQDKLLLSFGDLPQTTLQQEYNAIPSTAKHYDTTPDPKTCSGHTQATMQDRLTHLF